MGNVTKILIKPYLYICDEICPLEKLNDVKLTINTIKKENNQDRNGRKNVHNCPVHGRAPGQKGSVHGRVHGQFEILHIF